MIMMIYDYDDDDDDDAMAMMHAHEHHDETREFLPLISNSIHYAFTTPIGQPPL